MLLEGSDPILLLSERVGCVDSYNTILFTSLLSSQGSLFLIFFYVEIFFSAEWLFD